MRTSAPIDRTCAELALESHGVVTIHQLRASGYSERQVRSMVDKGHLHRLRRGVYAVGHLALGDDARRMAAVRAAGPGAVLAGFSAGAYWGIVSRPDAVVDVVVPRPRRALAGARIVVDVELASGEPIVVAGSIPSLDPTCTIVSLAPRMGAGALTRVLREASHRKVLDTPALKRFADQRGRVGVPTLRKALDLRHAGSAGYASRLEADVHRHVRRRGCPDPVVNQFVMGAIAGYEVDMVWSDLRICAEVDGPIHDDPDVQREDADRTHDLVAGGWTVLRIHWRAWEDDRERAIAPLLAVLPRTRST